MAVKLTDDQAKLLREAKSFGHVVTINKDGSPQVSPVWMDFDGTHVVINSEQTRRKVRNMKRDPRVSVSVQDPANAYHYIEIRGRVVEITPQGGFEHIDKMAKKYTGADKYPGNQPGDVRVIIKIEPEHVTGMG
jgi:PPOX class probable F420-dependent enzyme